VHGRCPQLMGLMDDWLTGVLSKLLLDGDIHLVEETLASLLLVFPVLFLVACLVAVLEYYVSVELEVEHEMLNRVFRFELAVAERVLGEVVRGKRVVGCERLDDTCFPFLDCQLLLVDAREVVLIHV
jgi:hypothetical protein